jgi:hypothetical protein
MTSTALDLLFAWAAQQAPAEQERLTVSVSGITSVDLVPPGHGYGAGTLTYTPSRWVQVPGPDGLPLWIGLSGSFSGTITMPQVEHREIEGDNLVVSIVPVQVPMVISAGAINGIRGGDLYYVTFYDPPQRFAALGSPTDDSIGPPINVADVLGSVTCTLPGNAFGFQVAAAA